MTAERIATIDLATLLALGEAPCTDCQHRDRCGDQNDQLACRDFAVSFVERGIVKEEYRLPSRYWWLHTQDIDDDSSTAGRADGLPPDWQKTYWRGAAVAAATRLVLGKGPGEMKRARAMSRRTELEEIGDPRLVDVFDAAVRDIDEYQPRTSTEWKEYCKVSGMPPVGSPSVTPAVRSVLTRVRDAAETVAVFVREETGQVCVFSARLTEGNSGLDWNEHVGTYDPKTFDPVWLIEDLAMFGIR